MKEKEKIMNAIWLRVEEMEAFPSRAPSFHRNEKKTALPPNKLFAIGCCGVLSLATGIFLIGENACWLALGLAPAAYLIDQYSWMEDIRNREAKLLNHSGEDETCSAETI